MDIKRSGSQPSGKGPAEYFAGTVRVDPLFEAHDPARALGVSVTFEPGARQSALFYVDAYARVRSGARAVAAHQGRRRPSDSMTHQGAHKGAKVTSRALESSLTDSFAVHLSPQATRSPTF